MNVLYWTDVFWPRIGGMETLALQFIEELQRRGHRCSVLTQKYVQDADTEIYRGISIRRFPFDSILVERDLKQIRAIREYLERALTEFCPDVVHINFCCGWGVLVFLFFRAIFSIPVVLTSHTTPHFDGVDVPLIKKLYASVDRICCVSKWVHKEVKRHLPEFQDKTGLIYNGLSNPVYDSGPLPFSPPVLLLLGRLSPEKGFDTAIRAFSLLDEGELIVAGDGSERMNLQRLAGKRVAFIGAVPRDQVPALINRATIVLVPSTFESFGLVALEAMQMGRPVIGSNVGGLPEVVEDGVTGLLVPVGDPAALADAIRSLLAEPQRAVKMGQAGRKKALGYTMEQNGSQYEALYRELV